MHVSHPMGEIGCDEIEFINNYCHPAMSANAARRLTFV